MNREQNKVGVWKYAAFGVCKDTQGGFSNWIKVSKEKSNKRRGHGRDSSCKS